MIALLIIIAVLLGLVLRELRRTSLALRALIAQNAPRDVSGTEDLEGAHFGASSIHEQSARILLDASWRLKALEGAVRYLRNYVWEVRDPRYIEDVRKGKESSFDKRRFSPKEDTSEYRLWLREQDIEDGFDRDIRQPALERERQARDAASGDSDGTSPTGTT